MNRRQRRKLRKVGKVIGYILGALYVLGVPVLFLTIEVLALAAVESWGLKFGLGLVIGWNCVILASRVGNIVKARAREKARHEDLLAFLEGRRPHGTARRQGA